MKMLLLRIEQFLRLVARTKKTTEANRTDAVKLADRIEGFIDEIDDIHSGPIEYEEE